MVRLTGPLDVPYADLRVTRRAIVPAVDQSGAQLAAVGNATTAILNQVRDQQIENQVADAELRTRQGLSDLRREIETTPAGEDGQEPDLRAMWDERSRQIVEENSARLRSPAHQRLWRARMDGVLLSGGESVAQLQQQRMAERARAGVLGVIATAQTTLESEHSTPEDRRIAAETMRTAISRAAQRRTIGADDAARMLATADETVRTSEEAAALRDLRRGAELDPYATRTLLTAAIENPDEAPESLRPVSQDRRLAVLHQVEAEINRRESEARARQAQAVAALRDTVNAQNQLMERGIMPSEPVDIGAISTLLGPDVAQNYLAHMAGASAMAGLSTRPSSEVAAVAAGGPRVGASDTQNLVTVEQQRAAAETLRAREADPGGYALQNNLMRHPDLIQGLQRAQGAMQILPVIDQLRDRGADAVELHRRGVLPRVAPLSAPEAASVSQWLQGQPVQGRLAFFGQLSQRMNGDAYQAMMRQLAPSGGDVTAYAGFVYSQGAEENGPVMAHRLMRGAELLRGGADSQTDAGDRPDRQRRPLVELPPEDQMRAEFDDRVGEAYMRMPGAEQLTFNSYRAYYAALMEEGNKSTAEETDSDLVRRSVGVATGGVTTWNGRQTLMPFGMDRDEFVARVGRAFEETAPFLDGDPRSYSITRMPDPRATGPDMRYIVEGVRNPSNGGPVFIELR